MEQGHETRTTDRVEPVQQAWFQNWYQNRTLRFSNEIDGKHHTATITFRHLAQPTPLEVRTHHHCEDLPKARFHEGLAQAIPRIASTYTAQKKQCDVRLDLIITDGAQVKSSSADQYCLWIKEVYQ